MKQYTERVTYFDCNLTNRRWSKQEAEREYYKETNV